jgi:DNA-binding transcriptional ArsR family regulator
VWLPLAVPSVLPEGSITVAVEVVRSSQSNFVFGFEWVSFVPSSLKVPLTPTGVVMATGASGHVTQALLYVYEHPDAVLREIAPALEMTERPLHRILSELVEAGYVTRERRGRRVRYTVNADMNLRGAYVRDLKVRDLLTLADRL